MLYKIWWSYQLAMWYLQLSAGEYSKIGRFVNEFLLLMTFLTVRGIKITKWQALTAYIIIIILAIFVGIGIKDLGTVQITNDLNNRQNPQIIQIQKDLNEIKEKLK